MSNGSDRSSTTRSAVIPPQGPESAGQRAAAQMLALREVVLPAAVIGAAIELLGERLRDPDPVTREAAAAVVARLRASVTDGDPD
ncbi:hypothetical protein [Kitasatospora sp. NPDC088351]|uniref:hypothetical protein n=1 Tax=unclassified Kitasatospora TaxID=2633591 RepID=UPI00342093B3